MAAGTHPGARSRKASSVGMLSWSRTRKPGSNGGRGLCRPRAGSKWGHAETAHPNLGKDVPPTPVWTKRNAW